MAATRKAAPKPPPAMKAPSWKDLEQKHGITHMVVVTGIIAIKDGLCLHPEVVETGIIVLNHYGWPLRPDGVWDQHHAGVCAKDGMVARAIAAKAMKQLRGAARKC